jgi:succinate dehydrogenase hydrophobic anchor subunit
MSFKEKIIAYFLDRSFFVFSVLGVIFVTLLFLNFIIISINNMNTSILQQVFQNLIDQYFDYRMLLLLTIEISISLFIIIYDYIKYCRNNNFD